jgi:hypothetical protein
MMVSEYLSLGENLDYLSTLVVCSITVLRLSRGWPNEARQRLARTGAFIESPPADIRLNQAHGQSQARQASLLFLHDAATHRKSRSPNDL